jgi:hypothetical protein
MKIPALASAVVRFPTGLLPAASPPQGVVPLKGPMDDHDHTELTAGETVHISCQPPFSYWSYCSRVGGKAIYRCCRVGYKCDPKNTGKCVPA